MATYKVLQDIEAEDTLIGPLTLRQCIYAAIAVIAIYLSVMFVTKHVPFLVIFMLPFIAFGVFFAFPWTKQQTTEVWALARIRFILKPRKRIWNQSGVKELVTITVPKNIKRAYASALTPTEVNSRLKALADTIDSRGWAIKNVDLGYYTKPSLLGGSASDRLVSQNNLPQEVPNYNAADAEDIFDVQNNPVAQKFDALMTQSAGAHREQIVQQMTAQTQAPNLTQTAGQPQQSAAPAPVSQWHMRTVQPLPDPAANQQYAAPQPAISLPQPVMAQAPVDYANLRTPSTVQSQPFVVPVAATPQQSQPALAGQTVVTAQPNPAILELANNNDLDIATIAREAQARNPEPPEEVVISFH